MARQEHRQFEELLDALSEDEMTQPNVVGVWSVKDVLAHVAWWEQNCVSEIVHGVEIDPGPAGEPWVTDRANALMVAAKRDMPLADVLDEFRASYRSVVQTLEGLTDDRLDDTSIDHSTSVYEFVADNTGRHYAEHRRDIEEGLGRR